MDKKYGTVGEDGCPCGDYVVDGFEFDVHCWRANCNTCDYSGIHIMKYPKGKLAEARKRAGVIKKYIKNFWSADCSIKIGGRDLTPTPKKD